MLKSMSRLDDFNNIKLCHKPKIPVVSVRTLLFDSVETYRLDIPIVKTKVQLSEDVRKCYKLPELFFSNHYPKNLDEGTCFSDTIQAFDQLNNSLDCIKNHIAPVRHDLENSPRIEKIIKKYLGSEYDKYINLFYKSDIRTGPLLSNRGSFRVVSLYTVEPKNDKRQRHSKHYLTILFFDPYHLFIPSMDYGIEIYQQVCNFSGECDRLKF